MSTATKLLRRALEEIESQDADLRSEFEGFNKIWQGPPIIEEIRAFLATEEQYDALRERYVEGLGNSMKDCKESFEREAERVKELLAAEPEAEPVAWIHILYGDIANATINGKPPEEYDRFYDHIPLYRHPPKPTEPEAEPVAQVSMTNASRAYVTAPNIPPGTLLYRHPPRPEPARKPMSEEEIKFRVQDERFNYCDAIVFAAGIRYAEKHHGIGGDET